MPLHQSIGINLQPATSGGETKTARAFSLFGWFVGQLFVCRFGLFGLFVGLLGFILALLSRPPYRNVTTHNCLGDALVPAHNHRLAKSGS